VAATTVSPPINDVDRAGHDQLAGGDHGARLLTAEHDGRDPNASLSISARFGKLLP
jgi:hypothetical protein